MKITIGQIMKQLGSSNSDLGFANKIWMLHRYSLDKTKPVDLITWEV